VTFALSLGVVITLHVMAVIKHQLVDRDGILSRMNPWPIRNQEA
jgi:cytochrome b561